MNNQMKTYIGKGLGGSWAQELLSQSRFGCANFPWVPACSSAWKLYPVQILSFWGFIGGSLHSYDLIIGHRWVCCRKGDPFQGPKVGSCLTLKDEMSKETQVLTKQETVGKRHLGGDQQGKGTQENCSAMWLAVSGFMVMGLVSGLSLANRSDPRSFLVMHASLRQDG